LSFDEAPLDEIPEWLEDGDNSLLENHLGGLPIHLRDAAVEENRNLYSANLLKSKPKRIVPFSRKLTYKTNYMRGKDVFAVSRALAKAGFRKWGNFTYFFGRGMKNNVSAFQDKVGLKTTGIYDLNTHRKLAKYFDKYGAFLMAQAKEKYEKKDPRDIIMAYALHGYNNRALVHYTQGPMRMYGVRNKVKPPNTPYYEDCSSYSTWCYWGSGIKDPNNLNYNGLGYTGTLALNGWKVASPKIGDLAFYGNYPYGHVVIYIGNSRCISHGSEMGPYLLNVYYRRDFSHFRSYI